ncbi:MAG: hypothetical protein M1827_004611 [Pycnora praestabilis]|nr:MAG: hypothetical protein M1827_004611 [Pycnora praestabilis]
MYTIIPLSVFALLPSVLGQDTSSKRGLVYVPNAKYPSDDSIWDSSTSDLTWYYNYAATPSQSYDNSTKLQFVPMLFNAPSSTSDTTFLDTVSGLIKGGTNITYVLGYNEPDGATDGGSDVPADVAAQTWIREMNPLAKMGVKIGGPACTGAPSGFAWLQNFFTHCAGNCTVDFLPVHWYGNFEGLASHIGQVAATYPNISEIWATEYADNDVSLSDSETFYNQSSQYFDRYSNVTHYSYFGSFRSDVSNVGPNAAMLTQNGKLTSIGSWYLGGLATKNVPKGAAGKIAVSAGWAVPLVAFAALWILV